MIKKRIISTFLLGLLLLVNWHNASFHGHDGQDIAAHHDHDHHHQGDHHHDQPAPGMLGWLQQLLGNFEHADLGRDHFEAFLHPQHQTGVDQAVVAPPAVFALRPALLRLVSRLALQLNDIPDRVQSFSDPPFLEIVANRGPPSFS